MARLAATAVVIASLAAAAWLWLGEYPIGLDFAGGGRIVLSAEGADPRPQIDRALRELGRQAEVRVVDGRVEIVADGLHSASDAARLLEALTPVDLRLLPVRTDFGGRALQADDEATFDSVLRALGPPPDGTRILVQRGTRSPYYRGVVVDEANPLVTSRDVVGARATGGGVELSLGEEAARRFHRWTVDHLDEAVAIVLEDRLLAAPVIRTEIPDGVIQIDLGAAGMDPEALARQLRRGGGVPVTVESQQLISPALPSWAGRPLAIGLGALAALFALFVMAARRTVPPVAVAAALSAASVGLSATLAAGATLSSHVLVGAAIAALPAPLAVAPTRLRGGPSPGLARYLLAAPGLLLFAGVWLLSQGLLADAGLGGVRATLAVACPAAGVTALLAVVALDPAPGRPRPSAVRAHARAAAARPAPEPIELGAWGEVEEIHPLPPEKKSDEGVD